MKTILNFTLVTVLPFQTIGIVMFMASQSNGQQSNAVAVVRGWTDAEVFTEDDFKELPSFDQKTNSVTAKKKPLLVGIKEIPALDSAEITTLSGMTYKSVTILKVEPDSLTMEYKPQGGGIGLAKVKFENLPTDLKQRFGYNVQNAAAYRTEQAEAQAREAARVWADQRDAANMEAIRLAEEQAEVISKMIALEKERERARAEAERVRVEAERVRIANAA